MTVLLIPKMNIIKRLSCC